MQLRLFTLFLLGIFSTAQAQYTLTGLKGLVNVPEAEVLTEKGLLLGVHTNHEDYFLIDYGDRRQDGSEYVTVASVGFYKRLSITMMLSRIYGDPKQTVGNLSSIGDRSLQITYLLFKESAWMPAIVINATDPLFSTNQYLAGNHIVTSKKISVCENYRLTSSFGYGVPYLLTFAGQERRDLVEKQSDFLTGFFGGLQYRHLPSNTFISFEYDGWNINAGAGVMFWDQLSLQVYLQNLKRFGFGINFTGEVR